MRAAVIVLVALTATAHAQEASDAFLEQRVTEELTADGILLSRLGVTLDVESVGDQLIVSLVDDATGRVAASTKIEDLPADRDAAVASLTQVVATLATQIRVEPEPAPAPAPDDGETSEARELLAAEHSYRANAIGFGHEYFVTGDKTVGYSVSRRWRAHQGELEDPLSADDFYDLVGRPDLARAYHRRRTIMKTAFVVGGAGAVAVVALAYSMPRLSHCPYTDDGCFDRTKERQTPYWWGIGISTAVAAIGAFVGTVYWRHPHPISESYAEKLAADYNEGLRESLGLVSLDVSPYVSKDGGGLAVAGSF